jgi:hypothetical protein
VAGGRRPPATCALRQAYSPHVMSSRYVGQSVFLRCWPPGMVVLGAVVLTIAGAGALLYCALFVIFGLVVARSLPWRFAVLDEGIALWFPFGRRLFLPKDTVTVRVSGGSPVAYPEMFRWFGYPLTDGLVERRRKVLRAVLLEHGFRVA